MKNLSVLIWLIILSPVFIFCQSEYGHPKLSSKGSEILTTPKVSSATPSEIKDYNWAIRLENFESFNHVSAISQEHLMQIRKAQKIKSVGQSSANKKVIDAPILVDEFQANTTGGGTPLDNSMAVSHSGFIVSGINSNVVFTNTRGDITFSQDLSDFFILLDLGTRMYDPRVIYDAEQRKFILMCLHGSTPATTNLCLAFSETEDPNGKWNYYKIDGNPLGDQRWFDYPNVAVTKEDLFLSGLMRNDNGDWQYSILFQVDKRKCFSGQDLNYKYYADPKNADGNQAFNLVPAASGWSEYSSQVMTMISNVAQGGDQYHIHYVTSSLYNGPQLMAIQKQGPATQLAPYGRQKSSSQQLNTFDSRVWSAMELNGIVHFGGHVLSEFGTSGLLYGRMNIATLDVTIDILADPNLDYGFPSFTSIGSNQGDPRVLVNYLVSGVNRYPSQEVRICEGQGGDFSWSAPVVVKEGIAAIDVLNENLERWGDYTTACRRWGGERSESWITGCYARSNSYGTWLGRLQTSEQQSVVSTDFVANQTTVNPGEIIKFSDWSQPKPDSVKWILPKSINPIVTDSDIEVQYNDVGAYDASIIAYYSNKIDTLLRQNYITVRPPIQLPIVDFSVIEDTIYTNDTAYYVDASLNEPEVYNWTFLGGNPSKSSEVNPKVVYKNAGKFNTALQIKNLAGTDAEIKKEIVVVLKRTQPIAQFVADKTIIEAGESISFLDLSKNGPSEWEWTFVGGVPSTSTIKNPKVNYSTNGTYAVSLKVKNEAGEATEIKEAYIQVGPSAVENDNIFRDFILYPNPVEIGDRVNIEFELASRIHLVFSVMDVQGRDVKVLLDNPIKKGQNRLSFSTTHLLSGQYYVVAKNLNGTPMKAVGFVVSH